jgi:hypothetical protein
LVSDHLQRLQTVDDDRFARTARGAPQSRQAAPRLLSLSPPPARRARTVTAAIRTLTGERDLAVGTVACLQTHGSRANSIRTCLSS